MRGTVRELERLKALPQKSAGVPIANLVDI